MKVIMLPILILLLFAVIAVMIFFIKLCSKRPWIAVIVPLVVLPLFAWFFLSVSHRQVVPVYEHLHRGPDSTGSEPTTAAIWMPGVEDEFEASVYPSRPSAVRSLGLRISEPIRQVFGDQASPNRMILFEGAHDHELVEGFGRAITRELPDIRWSIEPETVAVAADEVGIRLDLMKMQTHSAPWLGESQGEMTSGTIQATVLASDKRASIKADFVDKPWIENFYGFWNSRPNTRIVIAKSAESCLTQTQANRQAVEDACAQLTELLGQAPRAQATPGLTRKVTSTDVLEGDFILDRFVQSFDGRAGKIWRQALLIDASAGKIEQLALRKAVVARAMKMSLARMFFSVVGLLVLITVVYAFLNAATKGYYAWSLRIAGAVLALVVIILFLA